MVLTARILSILCLLALGAHFYRDGSTAMAVISLLPAVLLFIRRRWAVIVVQFALCLGAVEWLRAMAAFVAMRQYMGEPYGRLQLILGGVAALCLVSAGLLSSRRVWAHYSASSSAERVSAL